MDIRNAMACASVSGGILGKAQDGFYPELLLNTDMTTVLLETEVEPALTRPESAGKLKKERKGVSVTKDETQKRSIGLLVTTSAAGRLVCVIAVIKENTCQKVAHHLVIR